MADVEEYFGLTGKAAQEAAQHCDDYDPDYDDDDNEIDESNEQEEWSDLYGVPSKLANSLLDNIYEYAPDKQDIQKLKEMAIILEQCSNVPSELLTALISCSRHCTGNFVDFYNEAITTWGKIEEDIANYNIQKELNSSEATEKTPYPFDINEDEIPF